MKRIYSLAPVCVLLVLPFLSVQACGPDFFPDVFVHKLHPDHPAGYAAGRLGVLLSTYPRVDLVVAYRYLDGGTLNAEEQKAYHPLQSRGEVELEFDSEDSSPAQTAATGTADDWLKARSRYAQPPNIRTVNEYGVKYSAGYILAAYYENCQNDAFNTATATLESRAKTWGAHSAELAEWIKGQDTVFSYCKILNEGEKDTRSYPADVAANAPALLRQDRAYQMAAAEFYAGDFDNALDSFTAIAQDKDSPWHGLARYLEARTLVREAFLTSPNHPDDDMASFDPELMKEAQHNLEAMRNEQLPGVSPFTIESLLNLVHMRIEPKTRLREIAQSLAANQTDPYYKQDLNDLTWYLNGKLDSLAVRENADDYNFQIKQADGDYRPLTAAQKFPVFEKTYHDLAELRATAPLIDWLITFQSPAEAAKKHALAEWKRTASTPWLTVALLKANAGDAETPALIEAAARIPSTSPAWATVEYHRLRLLIDTGRNKEARAELATALPNVQAIGQESATNLFTGLRMRAATTLDTALVDAPRKILARYSEEQSSIDECFDVMKNPKRKYDCKKTNSPVEFSEDAAAVFNNETPLADLAHAAEADTLPPQLRQSLAIMTWVRAVLLKNESVAAKMLPLLPEKVRQQAGAGVGFHPLMTILRNPGLRPYLDSGVQRSYSYDFVESYGDNWWCGDWTTNYSSQDNAPLRAGPAAFLSPLMRETGEKEAASLHAMGGAEIALGSAVLDYARTHTSDPDLPEALYLTLRTIRYGCSGHSYDESDKTSEEKVRAIALEAGSIMRHRYPANPWIKKAAPYVWPVEDNHNACCTP